MTHPRRALVTAPLRGEALDALRRLAEVELDPWIDHTPIKLHGPDDLAERLDRCGATLLVCEADFVSGPVFERPLEVVAATRGVPSNVDLAGATAAGVPVVCAPGRNADAVAELTIGLLIALTRRILPADRDVRTGNVFGETLPYQRYRAWEIAGRTVGIVGYGAVGRALAWRLEGLGMKVITSDPFAPDASHELDDLLAESDVVSVHAAVTPETIGMFDAARFAAMKPGAVFINASRAALHDLDALVATLEGGHLGGAALDHFDGEQLPEGHPLTLRDDVVLTPHIGGATYDTETRHSAMVVADIERVLSGVRPERLANPEVWNVRT
ncbi:MAG: NAD(P)-dependent oxidoreductase [Acidimicrobiales bacterium]